MIPAALKGFFMSDELPTSDTAVPSFLHAVTWAFVFAFADSIVLSYWIRAGASLVVAVSSHALAVKWPSMKKTHLPVAGALEKIARRRRWWETGVVLVIGYFIFTGYTYVHSLRDELDTYVLPRTITQEQSDALRDYLSLYESYSVTVKANPQDGEAIEYAAQLSSALKRTSWAVDFSTFDGPPYLPPSGVCIDEWGTKAKPTNLKHDPKELLQQAFQSAHIEINCSGGVAAGDYKLYVVVGHRPLIMGDHESILRKFGRWIENSGSYLEKK